MLCYSVFTLFQENRFSTCDVCAAIREARERTLNPEVRKKNGLDSWWKSICSCNGNSKLSVIVCAAWYGVFTSSLYNTLVCRNEREKYAKHRHKAEKYPSKYMSIIIDGMDQDKTNIPHLISIPKALAGNYTLETHITGVRVHGRSTIMFIDCQQFPHDSNLTIELLSRVFLKYKVSLLN